MTATFATGLLLLRAFGITSFGAGAAGQISGTITSSGAPVAAARVQLVEVQRVTLTDQQGRYHLDNVPKGVFRLSVAAIGYAPQVRRVTVGDQPQTVDIALTASAVELAELQVTASPAASSPLTSPQPTSVLSGEDLHSSAEPSLGATLSKVAGVHSLSTGVGIGKPVIRGLTSNRVLVLDNGQRLETQQWGDEHAPNVETATAERIEVIRGPASVLYGSDALGGVINVIPKPLPDGTGVAPFVHGSANAAYSTNNRQPDGSVVLEGASRAFSFRGTFAGRTSSDLRTPDYVLWNSGNRSVGGSGALGVRGTWGVVTGVFSQRNERISLTDEDPAETPTQRIETSRGSVDLILPTAGGSRFELKTGYERNRRRELADPITTDVDLGLLSKTWTGQADLHHAPLGPFAGVLGLSAQRTTFDKFGSETLIPNTRAKNFGAYVFEQAEAGRVTFSAGARYDHRALAVEDDADLGVTAQDRTYNSVTGNVGVLLHLSAPAALVLNVGRGYRAPSSFDLFSNGVHEGTVAFERGDPTLKNETSLNTDLALRIQSSRVSFEIGGFLNTINDFIYSVPTGEIDPGSGFQIYDVVQGDARLTGFESAIEYHPTSYLHLQGTADYVRGQNRSTDTPLPNIPPFRATYSVRLEGKRTGAFGAPYFTVGGETNARQSRLDPSEQAFFAEAFDGSGYQSRAYTLVNTGGGFTLATGQSDVHVDLVLRNALNTAYADFLSRIKTNAPLPGMGRTLLVRLSFEF